MKHEQEFASHNASIVRGYAWHIYPDPATPGVMAGDNPFGTEEVPDPARATPRLSEGVEDFWVTRRTTPGLQNHTDSDAYLVVTGSPEPPKVVQGWEIAAARLDESFQIDQRGDRWVRLVRIISTTETPWGTLRECEFQVDRTSS
jgi:hypothetical protein